MATTTSDGTTATIAAAATATSLVAADAAGAAAPAAFPAAMAKSELMEIVVALDWTPNTNHTGLYVAAAKGWYTECGLSVTFVAPGDAGMAGTTPARLCAAGKADFAVAPSESAISFATSDPGKPRLTAVAALLQGSTSSICTLASSGIDRPAQLEGKRYASYSGRFEDAIVARMVTADGGDGEKVAFHPIPEHGYADEHSGTGSIVATMLSKGLSDSTWIFDHWEGAMADSGSVKLNYFRLEDYGIPYGYSPVLLAHPDAITGPKAAALTKFLDAVGRGYVFAAECPDEAADLLRTEADHPSLADPDFIRDSQRRISPKYLTADGGWGTMTSERWGGFVDFLSANGILTARDGSAIPRDAVDADALFTHALLA